MTEATPFPEKKIQTIEELVYAEQELQDGKFLENIDIEKYLLKIRNNSEILSHHINGHYAGFVAFYCNNHNTLEAYVTLILINPKFRGLKIAKTLLSATLASIKERGFRSCALEVKSENYRAIKIYQELGFHDYEQKEASKLMKVFFA